MGSNVLAGNISDWMHVTGINTAARKHDPQSLRHSLATNLLKLNEWLPVISEILGHKSTESTMVYLRVDIDILRQCALDVPFVPFSFYKYQFTIISYYGEHLSFRRPTGGRISKTSTVCIQILRHFVPLNDKCIN